jgi:transposase InsO family protein
MKYEAIRTHGSEHSVRKMCKVLGLKEAGYYKWLLRLKKNLERRMAESAIAEKVGEIFDKNKRVYGYRKMQRTLENVGYLLSEYKVRKIMRENGYFPVVTRKYKPMRNGKHDGRYYENKLGQKFTAIGPDRVWTGDITYIKTKIGFVYLAAVVDLYNREIVGYSISKEIDAELVKAALGNALARRETAIPGLIFHSDRGCQYSSKAYQTMLKKYCIEGSMSRPSCPYDNACTESFFSSANRECIYRKEYDNIEEVKRDLFEYIELFYNRKRIHSSLGYLSPVEYRLSKMA